MFDIGPSELIVVFVVALLVIGPEKLPGTIRTAGLWVGRFRRSFHKIKAEVEKELNADEIKRQLHNESILDDVQKAKAKVDNFAKDIEKAASGATDKDESDSKLKENETQESIKPGEAASTSVKPDTTANSQTDNPKEDNSLAGGLKQAVSYVNDISRDVKTSADEIKQEFKQTSTKESPKSDKSK